MLGRRRGRSFPAGLFAAIGQGPGVKLGDDLVDGRAP